MREAAKATPSKLMSQYQQKRHIDIVRLLIALSLEGAHGLSHAQKTNRHPTTINTEKKKPLSYSKLIAACDYPTVSVVIFSALIKTLSFRQLSQSAESQTRRSAKKRPEKNPPHTQCTKIPPHNTTTRKSLSASAPKASRDETLNSNPKKPTPLEPRHEISRGSKRRRIAATGGGHGRAATTEARRRGGSQEARSGFRGICVLLCCKVRNAGV